MATGVRRLAAMSAALLTVGLFVAAFAVELFGGGDHVDATDVLWFASFMAFPLVGLLILWHVPGNVVGWLFIAVGAAQTSGVLLGTVSNILRDRDPGSVAGAELFVWENICLGVAWVLATTYPLFLYPNGRLPSPRWRWVTQGHLADPGGRRSGDPAQARTCRGGRSSSEPARRRSAGDASHEAVGHPHPRALRASRSSASPR